MSLSSHLEELRRKHRHLSEQVDAAQRSLSTDDLEIKSLKIQKLKVKEEIERIAHA